MNDILIGRNDASAVELDPNFGNRHGMIAGATGTGEALASTLRDQGAPTPVEHMLVSTPTCRLGPISDEERNIIRSRSPVGPKYDTPINRESAAEMPARRADDKAVDNPQQVARQEAAKQPQGSGIGGAMHDAIFGTRRRQGMIETMAKQTVRSMGSQLGRQVLRGVPGGIFGGKR